MNYSKELKRIAKLPPTTQQLSLAALLASLFEKHDIPLTVVGGAAVQFYTNATFVTFDLDVILFGDTTEMIEKVMEPLGFKRTTMYRHFEHPTLPFVVEFPPSPIQVGSRYINDVNVIKLDDKPVRVIKIEDIIMDRIIAGVEWKDEASIQQAKLLWQKNRERIDLKYLTDFATKEGYLETLKQIVK